RNIRVRNGTIRSEARAISLAAPGGSGHIVEHIRAEGGGIALAGDGGVVRNNTVVGTTAEAGAAAYGIEVSDGAGIRVTDNRVLNPGSGGGNEAGGIRAINVVGTLIERNLVGAAASGAARYRFGIVLESSEKATVTGNHIAGFKIGIQAAKGATLTAVQDNLVTGRGVPAGSDAR